MHALVLAALSVLLAAPKVYTSPQCGGVFVLSLSLKAGGEFSVRIPVESTADTREGYLVLNGEENGRGGWLISVHRQSPAPGTENLISPGPDYTVDSKLDLDAMNLPYYPNFPAALVLPIRSTHRSLCIRFVNIRGSGSGAHAAFLPGSSVEFRVLRNSE